MRKSSTCEERCRSGLALAEKSGELLLIANFLTGLSIANREMGRLDVAQQYVERSLIVYAELDDTYGLIQGHLALGALLLLQKRFAEARSLFQMAFGRQPELVSLGRRMLIGGSVRRHRELATKRSSRRMARGAGNCAGNPGAELDP